MVRTTSGVLAEAFLKPGLEAVYSRYAFAVYPIAIQATGATGMVVPALPPDSKWRWARSRRDGKGHRDATRMVFIANPNNPTGPGWRRASWRHSSPRLPAHVVVALDEAYFEYTGGLGLQNGIEWLAVIPTSSCPHVLQGLRPRGCARGLCRQPSTVADMLNRVRQPFNVSAVGLAGAAAALDDQAHVVAAVKVAVAERTRVAARLSESVPARCRRRATSCCARGPKCTQRFEPCCARRHRATVGNYQLPEHLRVTLGTVGQNDRFLSAWRSLLAYADECQELPVPIVTIDGPSSSGKGTISRLVARASAGICWIAARCTGSVALARRQRISTPDDVADTSSLPGNMQVQFGVRETGEEQVMLDGRTSPARSAPRRPGRVPPGWPPGRQCGRPCWTGKEPSPAPRTGRRRAGHGHRRISRRPASRFS